MITITNPGLFTTIQDLGRWGYQAYGMPVAGAMDRYAFRMANILADNPQDAAAIEMTILGASYHFDTDMQVAICGADMQATLNGKPVTNWSSFLVKANSELIFQYAQNGCRSYLAVTGGFDVPVILGSSSTYTRAGIGGLEGRRVKTGDLLTSKKSSTTANDTKTLPLPFVPQYTNEIRLRVLLGPQDDMFTDKGISTFFSSTYTISADADRMGYRLEGPKINHIDTSDIVSDALCEGAIQIPGHGMPIVMMADRQTTGGYPKIGTVIGADLSLLAQAKPGDSVRFIPCTDEEAVDALQQEEDTYKQAAAWRRMKQQCSTKSKHFRILVNGECYNVQVDEE